MTPKPLVLVLVVILASFAVTCTATTYIVGDNSGWDISTDLDTWTAGKTFNVGDVLLFQYSSSNTVDEVTQENYQSCNATNPIQSSSNGNTTFTLTQPGDTYFISSNKLYCLGGMKLHVYTQPPAAATSPASAPLAGGALPQPSSKSDNPVTDSAMFHHVGKLDLFFMIFFGFIASTLPYIV